MSNIYLLSNAINNCVNTLPMIEIKYLDFQIDLAPYDSLLFTSKNSVIALENTSLWKQKESYAISEQTAKLIEEKGGNLIYTGNSRDGNEFAKEIISKLKNKKALYIRAKKVVSNISNILKDKHIDLDELIVYETVCKQYKNKKFDKNSIFIFTSPSTVDCFLKSFKWEKSYKAVVIGITTAKALPKDVSYFISKEKSIQSCINLAKEL